MEAGSSFPVFLCELLLQPFGEAWAALLPWGLVAGGGEGGGRPSSALLAERRWRRLLSQGAGAEVSEGEGCSKMAAASDP